jgi:23S rRNA pseudouridine2605 synthase
MTIQDETREGQRIAKVMARAGLCSRRDAEQWIADGRVSVNGEVLTSAAFNVSEADEVRVDGEPLQAAERTRLFLFHKPRGLVTTAKDPEGRPTIFDALPRDLPRVVTIGRLDINTEGLLLLTNDGGLARVLELPATGWLRRYRVRAHGMVTQDQLDSLRQGLTLDGIDYRSIDARLERQQGSNAWLSMGLREGKNREIKRVLEHLGLSVNRLIRISFGPFELADMPEGEVLEVPTRVLRDQLGPKLAKQAAANFDAPLDTRPAEPEEPPRDGRPMRAPREERREERRDERSEGPPRKRKHVSVLRAEARAEAEGPRRRIARATTADRKGREVKVERVSLANPPAPKLERTRRPARSGEADSGARREGARPPRREGGFAERRPREGFGEGGRPPRRDDRAAPRREGGFGERRSREASGEGREGARPPRRDDRAAPRREGGFGDKRPREGFGAAGREGGRPASRGGKPPGRTGGRPPGKGGPPRGGKPPGKPGPRAR